MYANIIFCWVLMEPVFVSCRAETSFSTFTSQQPFKRQVLAFIRVYPVLSKAFSLLPGTAQAINWNAVKVWVQGDLKTEREKETGVDENKEKAAEKRKKQEK